MVHGRSPCQGFRGSMSGTPVRVLRSLWVKPLSGARVRGTMGGAPVSRFKGVHGWSPCQRPGLGGPWAEPLSGF